MNNELQDKDLLVDYSRVQSIMLSIKSDAMDCSVAWCRFKTSRTENLERPKHKHVVHEIHYVIDGKMSHSFSEYDSITTEKGHFVLVPCNVLHTTSSVDCKTEYLVIAVTVSSDNQAINTVFSKDSKPFSAPITAAMVGMIDALKAKNYENDLACNLSTKLIVHSIILETVEAIVEAKGLRHLYMSEALSSDSRARNIEYFIDEHKYGQKLRGEDVAKHFNLTTRQLNRICNEQFGCSLNNYITRIRIESMKRLLEQSDYTLMDIAAIFGFGDECTFNKHFKKYAGVSPGKYKADASLNINSQK